MSPILWGQDEERLSHWDWAKQEIVEPQAEPEQIMRGVLFGAILSLPFWLVIFYLACGG